MSCIVAFYNNYPYNYKDFGVTETFEMLLKVNKNLRCKCNFISIHSKRFHHALTLPPFEKPVVRNNYLINYDLN